MLAIGILRHPIVVFHKFEIQVKPLVSPIYLMTTIGCLMVKGGGQNAAVMGGKPHLQLTTGMLNCALSMKRLPILSPLIDG